MDISENIFLHNQATGLCRDFVLLPLKYCDICFNAVLVCMFVYILVEYAVSSMVPFGRSIVVCCYFRTFESLK